MSSSRVHAAGTDYGQLDLSAGLTSVARKRFNRDIIIESMQSSFTIDAAARFIFKTKMKKKQKIATPSRNVEEDNDALNTTTSIRLNARDLLHVEIRISRSKIPSFVCLAIGSSARSAAVPEFVWPRQKNGDNSWKPQRNCAKHLTHKIFTG